MSRLPHLRLTGSDQLQYYSCWKAWKPYALSMKAVCFILLGPNSQKATAAQVERAAGEFT